MIQEKTRELIQVASAAIETVFARRGQISPIIYVGLDDKTVDIMPAPNGGNKNLDAALMRAYFAIHDIKRYVLIDEAWRLDLIGRSREELAAAEAFCNEHGVSAHPLRIEAVMFSAEDELGHAHGWRAIERKGHKARLGPLALDPMEGGVYQGRFVGLLPRRGRTQ